MKQVFHTTDLDNVLDSSCPPPDAKQKVPSALPKPNSESRFEANLSNAEQLSNPNNAIIPPPPMFPQPMHHLLGVIMIVKIYVRSKIALT